MTNQQTNQPGNRPITLDRCERASRLSHPGRLVHQAILRAFANTGQAPSRADLDQVAGAAGVEPAAALAWADDHPELSWALLDQPKALATAIAEFGPLLRDPEPVPPGALS
jgi:hypothetical protein